ETYSPVGADHVRLCGLFLHCICAEHCDAYSFHECGGHHWWNNGHPLRIPVEVRGQICCACPHFDAQCTGQFLLWHLHHRRSQLRGHHLGQHIAAYHAHAYRQEERTAVAFRCHCCHCHHIRITADGNGYSQR